MATAQDRPKDPIIGTRSTIKKKSSKNDDVLALYFTDEQADTLVQELTSQKPLGNGRGVKLEIYTRKKTNTENGREFDSTFMFCKAVQESTRGGFGGGASGAAPAAKRFVPKKSVE